MKGSTLERRCPDSNSGLLALLPSTSCLLCGLAITLGVQTTKFRGESWKTFIQSIPSGSSLKEKGRPNLLFVLKTDETLSSYPLCLSYGFSVQYILWSWKWYYLKCGIIWEYVNSIIGVKSSPFYSYLVCFQEKSVILKEILLFTRIK